jgi:hypothetical protein
MTGAPPPPESVTGSAQELRGRLARLRRRARTLFAVAGLARWGSTVVAALVLFFVADWTLDLPLGVRRFVRLGLLDRPDGLGAAAWGLLLALSAAAAVAATRSRRGTAPLFAFAAAGLSGVLVWAAVRFLHPLGRPLPDQELALAVERRYGEINDRVAAALDFEAELRAPSRGESRAMMETVVRDAAVATRDLEFAQAVSARGAARWTAGSLAGAAIATLLAILSPENFGLWVERSLLARDVSWPRATDILAVRLVEGGGVVVRDPDEPLEVTVGRPLTVHAQARGRVPTEVVLLDLVEGGRPLPRRMFALPGRDGLFQVEIRDVRRPFEFVLQGGDDDDFEPRYRVEITVPPRVLDVRSHLAYPAYLDRAPEEVEGGSVAVPEGTRVTVAFATDSPIAHAEALMTEGVLVAAPAGADGRAFSFAFDASESTRYRLRLVTAEGRENDPAEDTYEVRVEPDRPPQVRWVHPRGPFETTPRGRVPLLVVAEDDHAVREVRLEVRLGEAIILDEGLVPFGARGAGEAAGAGRPANDGPYGRAVVRSYVPLDVPDLTDAGGRSPDAPARLTVRFTVTDSKGIAKPGPWTSVDVYRPVEMERTLASRRSGVRAALVAAQMDQNGRRQQLDALMAGDVGDAERDELRTIQFAQAKIAQDVDQAVRDLLAIFNGFVYDRLGAENPNEKILARFDAHHRRTYGRDPGEDGAGEAAPGVFAGDPVFPYALYDELVQLWRGRSIFDTGLLDRMLAVLEDAVDAAARLAPAAHESLSAAVESPTGERLAAARKAQDALHAALGRTLASMSSWQSLNDMILLVRRVLEEQDALNERLDARAAPGPDRR